MLNLNNVAFGMFVESRKPNTVAEWSDTDSRDLYRVNLRRFGPDWHYAKTPVTYRYNSISYRTNEIDDMVSGNFFIAYGCSQTEGIGVADNEKWSSLLSEKINLPHLNYGKGGAGPDFQELNSFLFLKNSIKRPRFVVIQWPDDSRIMYLGNYQRFLLSNITLGRDTVFYSEVLKNNYVENHNLLAVLKTNLMWKLAGIPVFNFTVSPCWKDVDFIVEFLPGPVDIGPHLLGRDGLHFGPDMHRRVSEFVYQHVEGF